MNTLENLNGANEELNAAHVPADDMVTFQAWVETTADCIVENGKGKHADYAFEKIPEYTYECGYTEDPRAFVHMFDRREEEEAFESWEETEWKEDYDRLSDLRTMTCIYCEIGYWLIVNRLRRAVHKRYAIEVTSKSA